MSSATDGAARADASGSNLSGDAASVSSEPVRDDPRSFEEKRRDQLTAAPEAIESDADPRIDVSTTGDGATRIDIRKDAPIQP